MSDTVRVQGMTLDTWKLLVGLDGTKEAKRLWKRDVDLAWLAETDPEEGDDEAYVERLTYRELMR